VTGESVEVAFVDQGYTGDEADGGAASYGIHLVVVSLPEAKKGFVLLPPPVGSGLRAPQRDAQGAALRRLRHLDASQGRSPSAVQFITRSRSEVARCRV
jgi:hypothetical protein